MADTQAAPGWNPPSLTLRWGPYSAPTEEQEQKLIQALVQAHDAGFITLRKAVERLKVSFGIDSVSAFLEELEKERLERQKRELEAQHLLTGGDGESDDEETDGAPPQGPGARARGGKNATQAPGRRSNGTAVAPPKPPPSPSKPGR